MKRVLMVILMCLIASMGVVLSACKPTESTHKHDYDMTTWEKDDTYHWHECKECGDKKDQAAHKFVDGKCEECGYKKKETEPHTHDYDMTTWKKDDTYHWHECKVCGDRKDQAEHNFVDGKCKDCGYDKDEKPTEHQHTYSEKWSSDATYHWRQATCEHNELEIDRGRHDYGDGDKCKVCGYAKPTEAHVHDAKLTPVEGRDATCTEPGIKAHYKCSCGELFEEEGGEPVDYEDLVIPAAHKPSKVEAKAATCIAGATREYYECSVCHKKFDSDKCDKELTDKEITTSQPDPDKHTHISHYDEKKGTCNSSGTIAHYECDGCHKYFEDEQGNKPLSDIDTGNDYTNHAGNLELKEEDPVSCDEEKRGLYKHYECSECHHFYADPEGKHEIYANDLVMPLAKHDYTNTIPVADGDNGHYRVCRRCGQPEKTEDGAIKYTAHTQDAETCNECGYCKNGTTPTEGELILSGIKYSYSKDKAVVTGITSGPVNYIIASKITVGGKEYEVTEIAANAFNRLSKQVSIPNGGIVFIPDSITTIGNNAFEGQYLMKAVIIGDSVTKFGTDIFKKSDNGGKLDNYVVYYKGSEDQFKKNTTLSGIVKGRTVYYYSETRPKNNLSAQWYFADEYKESAPTIWTDTFEYLDLSSFIRYSCNESDKKATVIGFAGKSEQYSDTVLVIPEEINVYGEKFTVEEIADRAFYAYSGSASSYGNPNSIKFSAIILPESIKKIGTEVFFGQESIDYIVLGGKIESIGYRAFTQSVNSIFFSQAGLYFRGDKTELDAFLSKLKGMNGNSDANVLLRLNAVPQSQDEPKDGDNQKYWHFLDKNENSASIWHEGYIQYDDVLYLYNVKTKNAIVLGGSSTNIKIHETITAENVQCTVTEIAEGAFEGRYADAYLIKVEIPKSVTKIGAKAFKNQGKITTFVIPSGVKIEGDNDAANGNSTNPFISAFDRNLVIYFYGTPEECTEFFAEENPLTSRLKADMFKDIKIYAYSDTDDDKVSQYGLWKYNAQGNIEIVAEGPMREAEENGITFSCNIFTQTATLIKFDSNSATSVKIPDHVTVNSVECKVEEIGFKGFWNGKDDYTKSLKTIIIPDTVTTLGSGIFHTQKNLDTIVFGKGIKNIANMAFATYYFTDAYGVVPSQTTTFGGKIFFNGTEEDWNTFKAEVLDKITYDQIKGLGHGLENAMNNVYFYSKDSKPSDGKKYWHYSDENNKTNPVAWQ